MDFCSLNVTFQWKPSKIYFWHDKDLRDRSVRWKFCNLHLDKFEKIKCFFHRIDNVRKKQITSPSIIMSHFRHKSNNSMWKKNSIDTILWIRIDPNLNFTSIRHESNLSSVESFRKNRNSWWRKIFQWFLFNRENLYWAIHFWH